MSTGRSHYFILLTFLCLLFCSCSPEFFEALDDSDDGDYSGTDPNTMWICATAAVAVSQTLPDAIGNVTLLDQDGTNLIDSESVFYFRFLKGPYDWESDYYEALNYYFSEYYLIG